MEHHASATVVRNDTALFGWAFMAVWMSMLVAMTWVFRRDGGFHQFAPALEVGIVALFWLFGLFGCFHFFRVPLVRLRIEGEQAVVAERWPLGLRIEHLTGKKNLALHVVEGSDAEGDPYYRCEATLPSGRSVTLAERHDRQVVEAVRAKLAKALA